METTILIVDDDIQFGELLSSKLRSEGFGVLHAHDGAEGIEVVRERRPDLVVLDALMPRMDGWEACREIRKTSEVPIIFLSCIQEEKDKVRGLDLGADDYIGKPFGSSELLARIRAVLRREGPKSPRREEKIYVDGELVIDLARREAQLGGDPVTLTATETRILASLVRHEGEVVPQERLLAEVWGQVDGPSGDTVRQHIHHLRQKLEPDPRRPRRIVTRRAEGYQLRRLRKG